MELKFNVTIQETNLEYPSCLVKAEVLDYNDNSVRSRGWIDKEFPKEDEALGELIHEIVDDMFPNKYRADIPEPKQTPVKRGKSK